MAHEPTRAGLALRALRNELDLPARQVSIAAGLPEYFVSRIESGKRILDFEHACAITRAMGVTVGELAAKLAEEP